MRLTIPNRRRGVSAVETALVLSVLLLLVCGLLIGGTGVFRHQQVQCLACEGSRYASAHGGEFQNDGNTPPTRQQIADQAVLPRAVGMNPADVDVKVEWIDRGTNTVWDWDAASKDVRSVTATGEYVSNTVRVTVTYRWTPGVFWGDSIMQSVSELPLSN